MIQPLLSVRPFQTSDIELIINYWLSATPADLLAMGADPTKMPIREHWVKMLSQQQTLPNEEKQSYGVIWEADGQPVGHSNVNKIQFGQEAFMHLHMWNSGMRQKGMGVELVRQSLPFYFENLQLKTLYSEPYALNPAPNKTLEKAGFELVKTHTTTPGYLNFEQEVNLWKMTRERIGGL